MNAKTPLLAALLVVVNLCGVTRAAPERVLVLVASSSSAIAALPQPEIRRLYLGAPVIRNGEALEPLRNLSDQSLQEVFLQRVVFMSERAYEHQILSKVFRVGGKRPATYYANEDLVEALSSSPNAVSYMWLDAAQTDWRVKVVTELWRGSVQ